MTVKSETRTVASRVDVVYCDGPECRETLVVTTNWDASNLIHTSGWWTVTRINKTQLGADTNDISPWHFHDLKCLVAWARVRLGVPLALHAVLDGGSNGDV